MSAPSPLCDNKGTTLSQEPLLEPQPLPTTFERRQFFKIMPPYLGKCWSCNANQAVITKVSIALASIPSGAFIHAIPFCENCMVGGG